jgi:hypothetical protein
MVCIRDRVLSSVDGASSEQGRDLIPSDSSSCRRSAGPSCAASPPSVGRRGQEPVGQERNGARSRGPRQCGRRSAVDVSFGFDESGCVVVR